MLNLAKLVIECLEKMAEQTQEGESEKEREADEGITTEVSAMQ